MSLILIKLAWRNLFRNKRRTVIASIAIGIGLAALIFMDALWIGIEQNMVKTATASFLGDGQIHRKGFRDTQAVEMTINKVDEVNDALSQDTIVEQFTPRTFAFGMITFSGKCQRNKPCGRPNRRQNGSYRRSMTQSRKGCIFEGQNNRDNRDWREASRTA